MYGPADGPEQRQGELDSFFHDELDHIDIAEQLGDEAVDESLLDIAEAKMNSYWLERVTR